MTDLYRLVYTSKPLLSAQEIEKAVAKIMAASQRNNADAGVTGALMFNGGAFAQILEGPRVSVEKTFERIQQDARHSDVAVLQCAPVQDRGFPNWSMAFVGRSAKGAALWSSLAARSGFDLARLDGDEVFSVLQGLLLDEEADEGRAAATSSAPTSSAQSKQAAKATGADDVIARFCQVAQDLGAAMASDTRVSQLHAEALAAARTPEHAPTDTHASERMSEAETVVLREALMDERQRTTELRAQLDEVRVTINVIQQGVAELRLDRDRWVERARLLALAIFQEPGGGLPTDQAAGATTGSPGLQAATTADPNQGKPERKQAA